MTSEIDFGLVLGCRPSLGRRDRMDQIVQHPDILVAEAAAAADHIRTVTRCCIVVAVVVALDTLYYIASVAAAVQGNSFDTNSDIEPDTPRIGVVSALVLAHIQSH